MPRKRKQSLAHSVPKQDKNLTTRLIKISMKVEDHVYKNIAISVDQAKSYYQELMIYEPKCRGDMRSMQVIEKLTRCMTAIINEENGSDYTETLNANSNLSQNYCISPTYSDIDNDNVNVAANHYRNEFIPTDVNIDDSVDIGPVKTSIEVEIHRAMSSLSIKDTQDLMETADCSQSILRDFNNVEHARTEVHCGGLAKYHKEQTHITANKAHVTVVSNSHSITPSTSKDNIRKEINNSKEVYDNTVINMNTRNSNKNKYLLNIDTETHKTNSKGPSPSAKNNTKVTKCKRRTKKEMLSDANKAVKTTQKRTRKIYTDKNKAIKNQTLINNFNNVTDSSKNANPNKIKNSNGNLPSFSTAKRNIYKDYHMSLSKPNIIHKNLLNKGEVPIYNENVQNDLSWIENIRYVREISSNEFDPKYCNISDDFWENWTLPSFWDDNDFVL